MWCFENMHFCCHHHYQPLLMAETLFVWGRRMIISSHGRRKTQIRVFFLNPEVTFHCSRLKFEMNCVFPAYTTFFLSMFPRDRSPSSSAARCGTQTPHRCSHFSKEIQRCMCSTFRLAQNTHSRVLYVKIMTACKPCTWGRRPSPHLGWCKKPEQAGNPRSPTAIHGRYEWWRDHF